MISLEVIISYGHTLFYLKGKIRHSGEQRGGRGEGGGSVIFSCPVCFFPPLNGGLFKRFSPILPRLQEKVIVVLLVISACHGSARSFV